MRIEEMVEAVQRALGVTVDGRAGPETWGAIYAELVDKRVDGKMPQQAIEKVDAASERHIAALLPEVQPMARALVQKAAANKIHIRVISGYRSHAEQNALYAQGRSQPGRKVTNARGGHSTHNFGIAFDIGVFSGNRYLGDSQKYRAVGALGMDMGLEWGGNWASIVDQSHFELRPAWAQGLSQREMLAGLRKRVADAEPIYA
jgi:peptidoglycan L-alanyl-D-glutamate endopeptidase CwlK